MANAFMVRRWFSPARTTGTLPCWILRKSPTPFAFSDQTHPPSSPATGPRKRWRTHNLAILQAVNELTNASGVSADEIGKAISKRGFYFADRAALNQLLDAEEADPARRLRTLQNFA